jgi:hypothetical protein
MHELLEAAREVGPEAVRHTVVQAWVGLIACASILVSLLVCGFVWAKVTAKWDEYDRSPARWVFACVAAFIGLIVVSVMLLCLCDLLEPVGATVKAVLKGAK